MLARNGLARYKTEMPTAKLRPRPKITLRELTAAEMEGMYPLLTYMNPDLTKKTFASRLKSMLPLGYRAVGAFDGEALVGISGFWIGMRFWCGKQFDIDNFVVHPDHRGKKIGEKLVTWLEKKAIAEQCALMVLDTYIDSHLAQRFYHRAGFVSTGFHMTKIPGTNVPYSRATKL